MERKWRGFYAKQINRLGVLSALRAALKLRGHVKASGVRVWGVRVWWLLFAGYVPSQARSHLFAFADFTGGVWNPLKAKIILHITVV